MWQSNPMAIDGTPGKLVRDKIPEIMEQSGKKPAIRILDPDQYLHSLHDKLDEEVREVHEATNEHLLEEIGDVLEVLRSLAESVGATWDQVEVERIRKIEARGGFNQRIWLYQD
jgi:predicted house-cleaning noncanonical NTP pyrophosphatase (MazG superfamily)